MSAVLEGDGLQGPRSRDTVCSLEGQIPETPSSGEGSEDPIPQGREPEGVQEIFGVGEVSFLSGRPVCRFCQRDVA